MRNREELTSRYVMFRVYTIISLSTLLFYMLLFVFIGARHASYNLMGFVVVFIISFYIYDLHKEWIAMALSVIASISVVTLNTLVYFGKEAGFHYQFFALIVVIYLISDFGDIKQRVVSTVTSLASVVAFFACDYGNEIGSLPLVREGIPGIVRYSSLAITGSTAIIMLYYYTSLLSKNEDKLYVMANNDHLTGAYNRGYFELEGKKTFDICRENNEIFSVVLLDLDDFKKVNDTYGHKAGDIVLQHAAKQIEKSADEQKIFARYGGEEFVVLLPYYDRLAAAQLAEQLRQTLVEEVIEYLGNHISVSASFGVCTTRPDHESFDSLMVEVDNLLYKAKKAGKNCVAVG